MVFPTPGDPSIMYRPPLKKPPRSISSRPFTPDGARVSSGDSSLLIYFLGFDRYRNCEDRTLSDIACNGYRPAHRFCKITHQPKANPKTRICLAAHGTLEAAENPLLISGNDANSIITNH